MMQQGTAEWFAARLGRATGSSFADAIAKLKTGKPSDKRHRYAIEIVAERLTGQPTPHFETAAMRWGTDNEPAARIEYAWQRSVEVQEVGFIAHPSIMAGISPDGLIGADGGLEIKCPTTATHIETILNGMPADHIPQVQGAMWITGRAWWDFVSYDPRVPEHLRLFVQRIPRDDIYIANLDFEIRAFLADVDAIYNRLQETTK